MTRDLEIRHAELGAPAGSERVALMPLQIQLHNPNDRTLHVYKTIRAMRYDRATKTLELQLSDRGLQELGPSGNFLIPAFIAIDPQSDATLTLSVPKIIARLKPGTGEGAPVVEELPAYEAETVSIEIAFSSTPFYKDPRPRTQSQRAMMVAWAEGHATHRFTRQPR
jgi:hypothetical protein